MSEGKGDWKRQRSFSQDLRYIARMLDAEIREKIIGYGSPTRPEIEPSDGHENPDSYDGGENDMTAHDETPEYVGFAYDSLEDLEGDLDNMEPEETKRALAAYAAANNESYKEIERFARENAAEVRMTQSEFENLRDDLYDAAHGIARKTQEFKNR